MMDSMRHIMARLAVIEQRHTTVLEDPRVHCQPPAVSQLPALFKPHVMVSTVTESVGCATTTLAERMQGVEEDMVSRVKGQFRDYLEKLEKQNKLDSHLVRKAKHDLKIGDDGEVDEQHAPVDDFYPAESKALVQTYAMEDGSCFECYGNQESGFELRRAGRSLPTRFASQQHADMAVQLFRRRHKTAQQNSNQDYIQEK